jgi:hypothetical protein
MSSDGRKRSGKGRRSDIPWNEIQAAWAEGDNNFSSLEKRFNVKRHTIAKRAKAENWPTKGQVAQVVQSKVIDIATRKAIEDLGGAEAVAATVAADIRTNLQAIGPLYAKAAKLLDRTLERALRLGEKDDKGNFVPGALILGDHQGETTAVSDILSALSKFTRDNRLDAGLKEGVPTAEAGKAESEDEQRIEQAVLIVRDRKTEVA